MKQNIFKKMAAFLSAGLLLTACSQDTLMPEPETPLEKDTDFYINVAIASPQEQSTRAGDDDDSWSYDFVNGEEDEQKINEILFVFYNSSNKYVGATTVTFDGTNYKVGNDIVGSSMTSYPDDNDTKAVVNLIVPVSVSAGALKPAYVIAYVNPTTEKGSSDLKRSLEESLGLTRTLEQVIPCDDKAHPHAGFTMSNSVYYNEFDGSTRPVIAVEIPADYLLTPSDVTKADNGTLSTESTNQINIHVERVVAKVNVSYGSKEGKPFKETDNELPNINDEEEIYTLNFKVLGWGLSNVEKGTFLIKNFRNEGSGNITDYTNIFHMTNMSQTAAKGLFDTALPNWNYSPKNNDTGADWYKNGYRSFWALSPSYYNTNGSRYPSYSDEITDAENDANTDNDFCLYYRKFNEIVEFEKDKDTHSVTTDESGKEIPKTGKYGAPFGTPLYTLEHTMVQPVVANYQKRGVTCALIVGQYELQSSKSEEGPKVQTFFVRNGIKADGTTGHWIYPDEDALKSRILTTDINTRLYRKATGAGYDALIWNEVTADEKNWIKISHPDKNVTDGYTPNRFVSLVISRTNYKPTQAKNDYLYVRKTDGHYYKIVPNGVNPAVNPTDNVYETSIEDANKILYGLLNGVEKYQNGYAFFAVPIEHLWAKENVEMGDASLGHYGIVRNHVYNIKIEGIKGIGTGIGDIDVPIVPNVEEEKYYVKTEIRVLRWQMLPDQYVTLKP